MTRVQTSYLSVHHTSHQVSNSKPLSSMRVLHIVRLTSLDYQILSQCIVVSQADSATPFNYNPHPVDMTNLTLSREMQNMAERLAENAHDIWAKKKKEELTTNGGQWQQLFKTLIKVMLSTEVASLRSEVAPTEVATNCGSHLLRQRPTAVTTVEVVTKRGQPTHQPSQINVNISKSQSPTETSTNYKSLAARRSKQDKVVQMEKQPSPRGYDESDAVPRNAKYGRKTCRMRARHLDEEEKGGTHHQWKSVPPMFVSSTEVALNLGCHQLRLLPTEVATKCG